MACSDSFRAAEEDPDALTNPGKTIRHTRPWSNWQLVTRGVCAVFFLLSSATAAHAAAPVDWRAAVAQELPSLGHRNWIVVVDSAYPLQVAPGIETIETGSDHGEVIRTIVAELSHSRHVAPFVYTDAELPFVPESAAPGVSAYRNQLPAYLGSLPLHSLPHDELIKMLAQAGATFHVLVLKTTLAIPYTSVFFRLDCRYWSQAQEQQLRRVMKKQAAPSGGVSPR